MRITPPIDIVKIVKPYKPKKTSSMKNGHYHLVKETLPVLALICKAYGYKFYTVEGLKQAQAKFDELAYA